MPAENGSVLGRGQSGKFFYAGEMIPNEVNIQNLTDQPATYTLESGKEGWTFYGQVDPQATASILVRWPSGIATFTNVSVADATIAISGNGIFPEGQDSGK